jgi:hypothetical protein
MDAILSFPLVLIASAAALAVVSLGGGLYEFLVVDPFWPRRPDLIQPARGGVSRRRFWIPAHITFELSLIASLLAAWGKPAIRSPLLIALSSGRFHSQCAGVRTGRPVHDHGGGGPTLEPSQHGPLAARSGDVRSDVDGSRHHGAAGLIR